MKIKTTWEKWVEKVEAAWPIPATEIAKLCDCDFQTAARIRDHIASIYGQDPPRKKNGAQKIVWRLSRGIYREMNTAGRAVTRKQGSEAQLPTRLRPVVMPAVAAKPQHYAPGHWFRSKRSGEIVPALFVVTGSDVKFFGVAT